MGNDLRTRLLHEQVLIVEFKREAAIEALPLLLPRHEDRVNAIDMVEYLAGPIEEMEPQSIKTLQRFRRLLKLPPIGRARARAGEPRAGVLRTRDTMRTASALNRTDDEIKVGDTAE
jgi:hypothetical protein